MRVDSAYVLARDARTNNGGEGVSVKICGKGKTSPRRAAGAAERAGYLARCPGSALQTPDLGHVFVAYSFRFAAARG